MVDLTTSYMGVPIKNPLIIASGPTTTTPEICAKAAKYGWAGVVLKTNVGDDVVAANMADPQVPYKHPRPAYKLLDYKGMERWRPPVPERTASRSATGKLGKIPPDYGLVVLLQATSHPHKYYAAPMSWFNGENYLGYINRTKELVKGTGCKVIASISSFTEEGWTKQCDMINKSDADMVELNFTAPVAVYTDPQTGQSAHVSSSPRMVEEWTRYCVQQIKIPVGTAFPAHCPDPLGVVQASIRAGARGVKFGGVAAFMPRIPPIVIDPDTLEVGFTPSDPFGWGRNASWGMPIVCGDIAHFRMNGVEADISGVGGIRRYRDILRFIMAGASSVQACTATMVEGVEVGAEYLSEIEAWMESKGYQSIKEIKGIVVDKDKLKVDPSKFDADVAQISGGPTPKVRLGFNKDKCINCCWCESCCVFLAIKMENEVPAIDDKLCEVCGLCVAVCPTDALSIVPR